MGQEISTQQTNKCNVLWRHQQQQQRIKNNDFGIENYTSSSQSNNEKYTKHKDSIYTSSSISTASTTDDEHYRHLQKYNLPKQSYEKAKIAKKLSRIGSNFTTTTTTTDSTSDYQSTSFVSSKSNNSCQSSSGDLQPYELYEKTKHSFNQSAYNFSHQHQRKNSQSTDSGIYYSSCHCSSASSAVSSSRPSSSASSTSGCASSVVSGKSLRSLVKQKEYLSHHLYIKSYLDILEEDEKARALYKPAKPGGIRNYTPKILAETALSSSAPVSYGLRQRAKIKEEPWI